MPRPPRRIIVRRACQLVFLGLFVLLFFALAETNTNREQTDYVMQHGWAPRFLICLVDAGATAGAFIASRGWSWLLLVPVGVVLFTLIVPRFFCGYVCPLGTLIDGAGTLRRKEPNRPLPRLKPAKYGMLVGLLALAAIGLPWVSWATPLPILTRASHAVTGLTGKWEAALLVWPSVLLVILLLSLVRRRFWCNYLCPTGALLSLSSRFSLLKRTRSETCVSCGKCVRACTFDAVRTDDYGATGDCTWCGDCGPVCPVDAIGFGTDATPAPTRPGRREFLGSACVAGGLITTGTLLSGTESDQWRLRPPGALPEEDFLTRCIRCGLCAQNCPGPAISLVPLEGGLLNYGTPEIVPERAGCSPDCNNCGRACPTGAIRDLPLQQKNEVVIGRAHILRDICIPHTGDGECGLCYEVCREAGHNAIEMTERVVYLDAAAEDFGGGFLPGTQTVLKVPHVIGHKCVGCGLCVMVCQRTNVEEDGRITRAAVEVRERGSGSRMRRRRRRGRRG